MSERVAERLGRGISMREPNRHARRRMVELLSAIHGLEGLK